MVDEPLASGEAPPLGTRVGAGYELVRFLGAGGMGAVYEAVAPGGQRVAVKVLLRAAVQAEQGEMVERFAREARVTAALQTPHVVPILDAGIDERSELPFMVMALLVGEDLASLLERIGPLQPTVAARVFRQAAAALVAAHAEGIVHRDIKPANIFLDQDPQGRITIRLLDFGIAKWRSRDAALTRTGTMLGTPHYMSPEQCQSFKHAGPKSDIWSLAISLYETLSGRLPWRRRRGAR